MEVRLDSGTERDSWVSAAQLRRFLLEAPADPGLLEDLVDVRSAEIEE